MQAKKKLPELTFRPTVNPMRTSLKTNHLAELTPEGDYFCVGVMDENYEYMIYTTKDGKPVAGCVL